MQNTVQTIMAALQLRELPIEGGAFYELYRSEALAQNGCCCGTSIYYLLRHGQRSAWHKVASDEIWYYHAGDPVRQWIVTPEGRMTCVDIGPDIVHGQRPQSLIPAHCWQTAILLDDGRKDGWGLFGAAVFPGFRYEDFEGATDEEFQQKFPELPQEWRH